MATRRQPTFRVHNTTLHPSPALHPDDDDGAEIPWVLLLDEQARPTSPARTMSSSCATTAPATNVETTPPMAISMLRPGSARHAKRNPLPLPLQSPETHWSTDNIALNDQQQRQHGCYSHHINRQHGDRDRRNSGLGRRLAGHPPLRRAQGRRRQQTRAPASLRSAAATVSTAYRRRAP
jgi:hypothetical protein